MKQRPTPAPAECSICHFFYETGTKESPTGGPIQTIGYCRANPPTPFFAEGGRAEIGRFPIVLGTLWCGLFEQRSTPK